MRQRARRVVSLAAMAGAVMLVVACGTVTEPAAWVDGEPISRLEVQRETDRLTDRLRAGSPSGQIDPTTLRNMSLDRLISQRLFRQQAREEGIVVTGAEVDSRLDELIQETGGKEQFLGILQNEALSGPDLRRAVEDQLLVERLSARHAPPPAQVEQRRVRHILVDSEEKAVAARQRLANGETWEKVAAEVSLDTSSKATGGDIGFIQHGQTVPEFDAAAFGLGVNDLSQPVKSQFGYHVLQVTEARSQAPTPDQLAVLQQRQFAQYLSELRQNASVQVSGSAPAQPSAHP